MVPKLFGSGKSFKKLAAYLLHDPDRAKTDQRVRWTHTLNLANDGPAAVDEMLWTYRSADELKRHAGLKAGGRALENPVKHFSLNWHTSETPTREHMIETVENFLAHMKWSEHQALIVCHDDKHPHVHVMVNSVHPETGRALNTSFEKRRAQEWAVAYERENECVFCEERLKPVEERAPSPTREAWQTMKLAEKQHDNAERDRLVVPDYFERGDRTKRESEEWKLLKAHQRQQREMFFAGGKQAYREVRNAVFREVRTEFRDDWRDWFDAERRGVDPETLASMKADLVARQKAVLEYSRDLACAELREKRDTEYAQILSQQREQRALLSERQEQGLNSPHLFDCVYGQPTRANEVQPAYRLYTPDDGENSQEAYRNAFRSAALETCRIDPLIFPEKAEGREESSPANEPPAQHLKVRDGLDVVGGLGLGALGALAQIGENFFDGFMGGGAAKAPPPPKPAAPSDTEREDAKRAAALQAITEVRAAEEAALQASWDQRKRRTRERD